MHELWNKVTTLVDLINHLLPIAITVFGGTAFWVVKKYLPQLHYIKLVTDAVDEKGVRELAQYIAKKTGGKHINTDAVWESFVPAARAIRARYELKLD